MGVNIGWIFGSVAAFSVVWSALFFPELKVSLRLVDIFSSFPYESWWPFSLTIYQGRSLEEVDQLFEARLAAWKFAPYETHGTGHVLTTIENKVVVSEKQHVPSI